MKIKYKDFVKESLNPVQNFDNEYNKLLQELKKFWNIIKKSSVT
jgi:hypothetical protein